MTTTSNQASLIRNIADLLRWGRKNHEYQDVILPLIVLKRLDSVLAETKSQVIERHNELKWNVDDLDPILRQASGFKFYNTSVYDFEKLLHDPKNIAANLTNYINWFSENMQLIIEKFNFDNQIKKLKSWGLLFLIIEQFNKIDLSLETVSNHDMWYIFEELIRKFSEMSNETAWEHYTPREVVQLMVNTLLLWDEDILAKPYIIRTVYDPACGTGGMLTTAKDTILETINNKADIQLFWQELNPVTYAISKSDMLIKWENASNIRWWDDDHSLASTLSNDQFKWQKFDYILSNPPYWVDWKKDKVVILEEAERWFSGRFWAGTPRISDGQLLFLQHMISKMKPVSDWWSKIAVVFNGSPLFTGDAWSWESEIRRWVLENDLLDTIIWLPDQLFYNTGISTYIWLLSNRKTDKQKWKVKLIDSRNYFKKMRKSLWNKRHEISPEDIKKIIELYKTDEDTKEVKIFKTTDFGYRQITIERPLKDEDWNIVLDKKWNPKADSKLRDSENVPLDQDINEYFEKEVKPYVSDSWINEDKKYCDHKDNKIWKIWYELNFTRYFYEYKAPRSLEEIENDIKEVEENLNWLLTNILD